MRFAPPAPLLIDSLPEDTEGFGLVGVVDSVSPATDAGPGRLAAVQGGDVARHVQASALVRKAWRTARYQLREMRQQEGGLPAAMYQRKPPSLKEHDDYTRSKAWVPVGHRGQVADRYGTFYLKTIGRAGVAAGNGISGTAHKPFRATVAFLIAYTLTVIFLAIFGEKQLAVWMAAGLAAVVAALVAALRFWPQRTREGNGS